MLRVCVAALLISLLVAAAAHSSVPILFSVFVGMTGATLCMPVLNSIATQLTPAPDRGRMMGTTGSVSALGRVLGPLIAGGLLALLGYSAAWLFFSAVTAVYFYWALSLRSERASVPA
jgi:MFS family permease